jgi:bifunctional non-homologous end joining protein LigD
MKRFERLASAIGKALKVKSAVLDGEIVALNEAGLPAFYRLMRRKCHAVYYAFDMLWLDGKDLRELPYSSGRKSFALFFLKNRPGLVTSVLLGTRERRGFLSW